MTILFLPSFFSIDLPSLTEMAVVSVTLERRDGATMENGGINLHVCQRWRNLILGSASYLGLCLTCTSGKPIADMLAHSPPLPLIVDYDGETDNVCAKDEEGIALALEQHDVSAASTSGCPFRNYRSSSWV